MLYDLFQIIRKIFSKDSINPDYSEKVIEH